MTLAELTPYVMLAFGIVNGLLGMVYLNMREKMREDRLAAEKSAAELRNDLKEVQARFETFRNTELANLHLKIDEMKSEVTQALTELRLALAENYVKKPEIQELTRRIEKVQSVQAAQAANRPATP